MIYSKDQLEKSESEVLAAYAVLSGNSRGRKYDEPEADNRLCFQKDRDRILHSRAWRRMKGKTQVFVPNYGDHYRNRLTHSLEVAQLARDMARTLGLNEDLSETIGLAHDLGHTPFGHAGEHALHECLKKHGLEFEHNEQSRRVIEELEKIYPEFPGLNLSIEVIEGMMKHHTSWDNPAGNETVKPSLEAQIVNFADEIAYQNHDTDDGLRSGLFSEEDLRKLILWQMAAEAVLEQYGEVEDEKVRWARTVSKMIGLMVSDVCEESSKRLINIKSLEDVYASKDKLIGFSEDMIVANKELKDFLIARLYFHPQVVEPAEQGQQVVRELVMAYLEQGQSVEQVRDYLAGMTDQFAQEKLKELQAE